MEREILTIQSDGDLSFLEGCGVRRPEEWNIPDRWERSAGKTAFSALLGVEDNTRLPYTHSLRPFEGGGACTLLIGAAGAGKTEAIKTWLLSLSVQYAPQRLRYCILDNWAGEYRSFSRLPHCEAWLKDAGGDFGASLRLLREEMARRRELQRRQRDGEKEADRPEQRLPALLFVVDTADGCFWREKASLLSEFAAAVRECAGLGIHVILAAHPAFAGQLIRAAGDAIASRWIFSGSQELASLGSLEPGFPLRQGEAILDGPDRRRRLKFFYSGSIGRTEKDRRSEAEAVIEQLCAAAPGEK